MGDIENIHSGRHRKQPKMQREKREVKDLADKETKQYLKNCYANME